MIFSMIYTLQWFRFHDVFSIMHITLLFSDALISERPTVPVNVASIQGIDGGKDTCPRCGGQVFHAERMLSKVWPLKHFSQPTVEMNNSGSIYSILAYEKYSALYTKSNCIKRTK